MNNGGSVNTADIAPFYMALQNPALYATTYPGLGEANPEWNSHFPEAKPRFLSGPVLFHADCNCDGLVNWNDLNACTALWMSWQCANACDQGDAVLPVAPEEVAFEILTNVDSEILPAIPEGIESSIEYYENPDVQAYWVEVKEYVEE